MILRPKSAERSTTSTSSPNALLAIRPDNIGLVTVFPDGPNRTKANRITLARREALADPEALAQAQAKRAAFSARVAAEDNAVNELQQMGGRIAAGSLGPPQPA